MTRENFAAAVSKVDSEESRGQWFFVAIYIGGMLVIGLPFARIPKEYWWAHLLGIILLFGWIIGPIPILLKAARARAERNNLRCPECGKHFLGTDRKLVLAGGNCCYCGNTIIEK